MKIVNNKIVTEGKEYLVMYTRPKVYSDKDLLWGEIRQGYCVGGKDERYALLEVYY